jgi:hypothetical protein
VEGHTGAARGRCKASLRTAGFPITGLLDVPQRRLGSSAEGVSFWVGG